MKAENGYERKECGRIKKRMTGNISKKTDIYQTLLVIPTDIQLQHLNNKKEAKIDKAHN